MTLPLLPVGAASLHPLSFTPYDAALALCERAEAEMTALEQALHTYHHLTAELMLCLAERHRTDPVHPAPALAQRRNHELRVLRRAAAHDDAVTAKRAASAPPESAP